MCGPGWLRTAIPLPRLLGSVTEVCTAPLLILRVSVWACSREHSAGEGQRSDAPEMELQVGVSYPTRARIETGVLWKGS